MMASDNDELVNYLLRCAEQARSRGALRDARALERAAAALRVFPVIVRDRRAAGQVPGIGAVALRYLASYSQNFACETILLNERSESGIPAAQREHPQRSRVQGTRTASSAESMVSVPARDVLLKSRALSSETLDSSDVSRSTGMERAGSSRAYRPRRGSAAAALLIGLLDLHGGPSTKPEIVSAAQRYTTVPLVRLHRGWNSYRRRENPDTSCAASSSWYDGWSTMNGTLLRHGLVCREQARPRKYVLTMSGIELAKSLAREAQANQTDAEICLPFTIVGRQNCSTARETPQRTSSQSASIRRSINQDRNRSPIPTSPVRHSNASEAMPNHDSEAQETLQVCLVIDYREKPEFQTLLRQLGIAFWVRVLPTGDALWVARAPTSSPSAAEDPSTAALSDEHAYLLNVLVERKPIPDLIASIRDQRYRIQKARMRQSGLERLVYLIEGDTQPRRGESASDRIRLEQTILSAQLHTKMRDGFHIVRVANAVVTAQWYQQMTLQFQQRLRMGDRSMLVPCLNHTTTWLPLGVWRRDLQRQEQLLPLRAILCRQLQALPGIRERTALTILQCTGAGSAHELYEWFQEHASEAENVTKLSEESKYLRGNGLRSVPENVSALLWQLFT